MTITARCTSVYDFCIPRGSAKSFVVAVRHLTAIVPLTGYDAKLTAVTANGTVVLALTTAAGGGLVIDQAGGTVTVTIKPSLTLDATWRTASYDLLVWHPGLDVDRYLIKGTIDLDKTITHR